MTGDLIENDSRPMMLEPTGRTASGHPARDEPQNLDGAW